MKHGHSQYKQKAIIKEKERIEFQDITKSNILATLKKVASKVVNCPEINFNSLTTKDTNMLFHKNTMSFTPKVIIFWEHLLSPRGSYFYFYFYNNFMYISYVR